MSERVPERTPTPSWYEEFKRQFDAEIDAVLEDIYREEDMLLDPIDKEFFYYVLSLLHSAANAGEPTMTPSAEMVDFMEEEPLSPHDYRTFLSIANQLRMRAPASTAIITDDIIAAAQAVIDAKDQTKH
jgi:hypothetical protein